MQCVQLIIKEFRKNIETNLSSFLQRKANYRINLTQTSKDKIFFNKVMEFTPQQYRKVEQEFLQQFNLRSLEFYDQNVNNESIIQYKKLINLMQTRRKQYLQKKERFQLVKNKNQQLGIDKVLEQKQQQKNKLEEDDDEFGVGFYITENYQSLGKKSRGNKNKHDISQSQAKSSKSLNRQSTMTLQQKIFGSQNNQNLNLDSLQDRIYTQYNVQESLSHEQSQVQQAIFCFKRRISDLQEQLSSQNMKSKEVERLFVQNNNEMMRVKYTNQEVRSAFSKTNKHFALDLDGRKQIQQKCSQENKTNFQSSIINHISLQKMKQKTIDQEKQLIYLKQKKQDIDLKAMKYQSIYVKEQQFLRTYEAIMKINPDDILKEKLVSMMDKDFQDCQDINKSKKALINKSGKKLNSLSRKSLKLYTQQVNQSQPLPKIVSSLIDLYKKLKHESVQKASQYKILLSQKEEKESQLAHLLEKINSAYDCFEHGNHPKDELDRSELNNLIKKTHEIGQKRQQMNGLTIRVQERIVFWLSKQLALVQKIMKAFLRSDQQSLKSLKEILQKTYSIPPLYKSLRHHHQSTDIYPVDHQERELHIQDSRNMLINSFQNWQDYLEYLYIMHESKYIQNYISEKKLFRLFKRIIKTKMLNKQLPTEQIFEKGIEVMFEEGRQYHLGKIRKLLEIFKDMNDYFDKVKTGDIQIHCTITNESLTAIPDQSSAKDQQQVSKYPTQKELIRNTLSINKTFINLKNSPLKQSKLKPKPENLVNRSHEMLQTFASAQKLLQPNNLNEINMISRLKKKKHMTSQLNINGFYQQLRQQMQKIQKISVQ